jgi:hypothetical protein
VTAAGLALVITGCCVLVFVSAVYVLIGRERRLREAREELERHRRSALIRQQPYMRRAIRAEEWAVRRARIYLDRHDADPGC